MPPALQPLGLLAILGLILLLGGCATEQEDRAFFHTGWIRPESGAHTRMMSR